MVQSIHLFDNHTISGIYHGNYGRALLRCFNRLIANLKQKFTILIVTHSMQQAARFSDYTAFMYLGELVEFGQTKEVFAQPENKETKDYISGRIG